MKVLSWIRAALMVVVLAAAYDYLLAHTWGYVSAIGWADWWMAAFPTKDAAALSWLIATHTAAVLAAAAPVALASLSMLPGRPVLLAAIAGLAVTVVELLPETTPELWPLEWGAHPVFFVTDQLKIIVAMPVLVWLLRKLPSGAGLSGRDLNNVPGGS